MEIAGVEISRYFFVFPARPLLFFNRPLAGAEGAGEMGSSYAVPSGGMDDS